jgi:hypothetical protein
MRRGTTFQLARAIHQLELALGAGAGGLVAAGG